MRCIKCRTERVTKDRQKLKADLVAELGGQCIRCSYSKSIWSMHFHHRDRSNKDATIAHLVRDRRRALAFEEIKKCDLVCSNCHGEIEEELYFGKVAQR